MRVCTLASSSKGNCVLVFTEKTKILIDVGIKLDEVEKKLQLLNIQPQEITAILNTHEHTDHIKGIAPFMRKYGTPLYCYVDGYDILITKLGKLDRTRIMSFVDLPFEIGEFEVNAFKLPHDSVSCVGFTIKQGEKIVSVATDLGHITPAIEDNLLNSRLVVLEANHDEKMLLANTKYSYILKNRILGKNGHLSNATSAKVISKLATHGVKQVLLAHLSEENNTPDLCYNSICTYLDSMGIIEGTHIKIAISPAHELSNIFVLK